MAIEYVKKSRVVSHQGQEITPRRDCSSPQLGWLLPKRQWRNRKAIMLWEREWRSLKTLKIERLLWCRREVSP